MRGLVSVVFTGAMLTSTTVPESEASAAYNAGTTYAANAYVYVGTVGQALAVYKSLQASNTNHTPASSPTWWQSMGNVYAEYAGGTTYALGDIIQVAASHRCYQSLAAGNTGNAVTDTTKWVDYGPTNRWCALDTLRNTQAVQPSPMTYVIAPGVRCNSLFLGGMVANSAEITVTSVTGGGTVYHETVDLNTRVVTNWYQYFFEPFSTRATLVRWDLPPYLDAIITVTLTSTSGSVSLGAIQTGSYEELGTILAPASPGSLNFSSVTRDTYGNATVTQRKGRPTLVCQTKLDSSLMTRVKNFKTATDAMPTVWAGLTDDTDDFFESLAILGLWKKFDPVIRDGFVEVNFELEEI